jgi:hypothetical protein
LDDLRRDDVAGEGGALGPAGGKWIETIIVDPAINDAGSAYGAGPHPLICPYAKRPDNLANSSVAARANRHVIVDSGRGDRSGRLRWRDRVGSCAACPRPERGDVSVRGDPATIKAGVEAAFAASWPPTPAPAPTSAPVATLWSWPVASIAPVPAPVDAACTKGLAKIRPTIGSELAALPTAATPLPIAPAGAAMPSTLSAVPAQPARSAAACDADRSAARFDAIEKAGFAWDLKLFGPKILV